MMNTYKITRGLCSPQTFYPHAVNFHLKCFSFAPPKSYLMNIQMYLVPLILPSLALTEAECAEVESQQPNQSLDPIKNSQH